MNERERPIPQEGPPRVEHADLERLSSLWDAIYGEQPGYLALLSGERSGRRLTLTRERFFRFPEDGLRAAAWIRREDEQNRECYQCAHLLVHPRRRKDDAASLASLYADVDHGDLGRGVPEPTVLIASSPGRLQAYWRLTEPVPPALGEELNRRLAYTLGADVSGWDLTQLLRVPGTHNHKYPDAPAVQLLELTDVSYEPSLFARILVPLPERSRSLRPQVEPPPRAIAPAIAPPVRLSQPAAAVWAGQDVKRTEDGLVDRSVSLVRIARVLYEAGMEGGAIATALAERDITLGWGKYAGRRDAASQYQAIVAVVEHGARTRRRQR